MDFKKIIVDNILNNTEGIAREDIESSIEIPPNFEMGDYALPCFKFAKVLRNAPNRIAEDIVTKLGSLEGFDRIENVNGYINFFVDKEIMAKSILEEVIEKKDEYGSSNMGDGKNIVIDYSSPNIAKPFHVGHLRSTVIGNSLYKIYKFLGYNPIGINHLGDWGTQFGKMICAYKKWGVDEEIEEAPIKTLQKLYVKFHDEAEKDPNLEDEGREWFKKLENGDEEAKRIWKWFIELSLEEFNRIYSLLKVKFDYYTGESFYEDKMDAAIELMKEKNVLTESEGALVVDLEEYNMPPCLIVKSDGTTIYATRDITAALYRKKEFDFEKAIYITDYAQNLHFKQWFKVIELMGYDWADDLIHAPFGRVSTEEGKLQTRKGNVILLEDLLSRSIEKVKETIESKNPELENKDEVAKMVGIGAVIFNDLSNNKIKDIVFNWDRMLSFEGETGPYLQYTAVRAKSILSRVDKKIDDIKIDYSKLLDQEAVNTIRQIGRFNEIIVDAMEKNEPSFISRYLLDLAHDFNKFYHECPILNADEDIKIARLALVNATETVLETGLGLLGIDVPEKM
ncbi:MAG: arginine--tRNA ligase [Andreesenia angusta]|nr:arginine--tRNA ligase [Andreesenia angusta]